MPRPWRRWPATINRARAQVRGLVPDVPAQSLADEEGEAGCDKAGGDADELDGIPGHAQNLRAPQDHVPENCEGDGDGVADGVPDLEQPHDERSDRGDIGEFDDKHNEEQSHGRKPYRDWSGALMAGRRVAEGSMIYRKWFAKRARTSEGRGVRAASMAVRAGARWTKL